MAVLALRTRTLTLLAVVAVCGAFASPGVPARAADNPSTTVAPEPPPRAGVPVTVPALQEWVAGGRAFELTPGAIRLEVAPADAAALLADAGTFADDLEALTGQSVVVQTKKPSPGVGPGVLRMAVDPALAAHGPEAYRIEVDHDVTISGPTSAGVFAGTRSVLQLLRQDRTIAGGTATDWPSNAERSLMVDNGRKYYTPEWTKRQIRELSYLKYNQFHWHIADNAGFRIESKRHPEVMSAAHWTHEQVRDLVQYAQKYHVEVVPEIDMPGHMQQALRTHPEFQAVNAAGNRNPNNLDPTNPAARAFAKDLLDEVIPLFPGRYVHTGGDEYTSDWNAYPSLTQWAKEKYGPTANSHDAILDFTNDLNALVRQHGKTMRIWNDGAQGGATLEADRNIVLEYWSIQHGDVRAQEFLDRGYRITNANRDFLYDVPAATPAWNNTDPRKIFDSWDMTQYHGALGPNKTQAGAAGVLGGQLHLWNDDPTASTEQEDSGRLNMPLRAMSQQLWGSRVDGDWDTLAGRAFLVDHSPGWDAGADGGQDLARGGLTWATGRETPSCREDNLVDGNPRTRWCGVKTEPQAVVLDLRRPTRIGTVVLHWETAYASGYSLETSSDLRTWTPLFATSTGDGGVDVDRVSGTGRFLRVSMTERGTKYGYSLYDIEVRAQDALVPADYSASFDPSAVLLQSEKTATSTLTVSNASSRQVEAGWRANPPDGITVAPSSGSVTVPAGGSAKVEVTVSGSVSPGAYPVPVTVTGSSLGSTIEIARATLPVSAPYPSLAAAFNNVAATDDADVNPPTLGPGFDGAGSSYSAQQLTAVGLTPGATVESGGMTYRWPDAGAAEENNVVANGQTIAVRGSGTAIGVLVSASYGPAGNGQWTVHYADGTATSVRMDTPDWGAAGSATALAVATMTHRNVQSTGHTARTTRVFAQQIPVNPDKEVAALTIPTFGPTPVRGSAAVHVFGVALGTP